MNFFCKYIGHNYRPRYSSYLEGPLSGRGIPVSAIEALKTKKYHSDVCTRCGDIINNMENRK